MGRHGLDSSGSVQGKVTGCCVHGTELSVSTKSVEFIHLLKNYQLFERKLNGVRWPVSHV